jgi:Uma2 family endonuclease
MIEPDTVPKTPDHVRTRTTPRPLRGPLRPAPKLGRRDHRRRGPYPSTHPRPAPRHARASSSLGFKIGSPFDQGEGGGPGGWWILDEPELHLGENILVPDLAGWRRERMPQLPETAQFELAPDWVCQLLSPATARADRILPSYAAAAIDHCWLIDPDGRLLGAYAWTGT